MQENTFINKTGSGIIINGAGVLTGMYVNSTNAGTVKIWNNTSATGSGTYIIFNTITPAIGYHYLGDVQCTLGAYASVAGTALDVTFFVKATN
jgi:hypothetical protein